MIKQKEISDTFKKIKNEQFISTSQKEIKEICDNINKTMTLENASKKISDLLEKTGSTLKKAYKNDIKIGLALSLAGALLVGGSIAIADKIKRNKQNN